MKIRADEHVAQGIVTAVRDMALSTGWILDSVREAKQRGQTDVHWITEFMRSGGDAILTADRDFCESAPQVQAVFATNAKVIHLPKQWGMARGYLQAAHILMWWPRIEVCLTSMRPQQCFRPSWNISEAGELKRVPLDFQKAQQKVKSAGRRR